MENQFSMSFSPFMVTNKVIYHGVRVPTNFYPNECVLMRHVLFRQVKKMNTFIIVVGSVRSGKSYFSLKFAEDYSILKGEEFDVKQQCSFDIKPFLLWSRNTTKGIFILEEVSSSMNPTEWFTVQVKIMRNFVFCQGFRNNILIMTLPNVAFLLKAIRWMSNYVIETSFQGFVSVSKIQMNHTKGLGYPVYIGNIKFHLPTEKTIKEYEDMKKEWNNKHLQEDLNYIDMLDQPDYSSELRMKKLELDVKLREKSIEKLNNIINPKKDVIDKINEVNEQKAKTHVLRQRILELSVALKQNRLDNLNEKNSIQTNKDLEQWK